MGLDDLLEEAGASKDKNLSRFRTYGSHRYDPKIEDWLEELQKRFPEEIEYDFFEVSPELEINGKAYWRKRDGKRYVYIRMSEHIFDEGDWRAKQTLLHEMVHVYFYQNGYTDVSDGDEIFGWVCGQVGCVINSQHPHGEMWKNLAVPFITEDLMHPSHRKLKTDMKGIGAGISEANGDNK